MNHLVGDRNTVIDAPDFWGDHNDPMTELMLTTSQVGDHNLDPANTGKKS